MTTKNDTRAQLLADARAVKLDDLYSLPEALAYVNEAAEAAGGRPLTLVGFKRHVYDNNGLFQLEPVRIGRRPGRPGERRETRAMGIVFTRRMLDEYLANREANRAAPGGARVVTRPTAAERRALMSWSEAHALLNALLARRKAPLRVSETSFNSYRSSGKLPSKVIGKVAVYTLGDVEAFAGELARRSRTAERISRGRPVGSRDAAPRKPRRRAEDVQREEIFDWLGKTVEELRAVYGVEGVDPGAGDGSDGAAAG